MERTEPAPGQTSVWDYPRQPIVVGEPRRLRVYLGGIPIADTTSGLKVLQRGQAPSMYLPRTVLRHVELVLSRHRTTCQFKGEARYFHMIAGGRVAHLAAWAYPEPRPGFNRLQGHVAVDPSKMDRVMVDDEIARPWTGTDVSGWITDDIAGLSVEADGPTDP